MNMKYFFLLLFIILFSSCNHKTKQASILFSNKELDFNTLIQGEEYEGEFIFLNTGDKPLYIEDVKADCGCSSLSFPENGIKPGDKGKIFLKYKSDSDVGNTTKVIVVKSNTTPKINTLYLVGNVVKP